MLVLSNFEITDLSETLSSSRISVECLSVCNEQIEKDMTFQVVVSNIFLKPYLGK